MIIIHLETDRRSMNAKRNAQKVNKTLSLESNLPAQIVQTMKDRRRTKRQAC